MIQRAPGEPIDEIEPVLAGAERRRSGPWTERLILFLRLMGAISILKGLYHWAVVCGFVGHGFLDLSAPTQTATAFFAVIDLVAAVGLWLAAPWGAVVWLTASVSMGVIEGVFPQVYGGRWVVIGMEAVLILGYLVLAIMAAREQPN
jgi:Family of unknown function (DUF6163)